MESILSETDLKAFAEDTEVVDPNCAGGEGETQVQGDGAETFLSSGRSAGGRADSGPTYTQASFELFVRALCFYYSLVQKNIEKRQPSSKIM